MRRGLRAACLAVLVTFFRHDDALPAEADAGAAFIAALNGAIERAAGAGPKPAYALCDDVAGWALDLDAMAAAVAAESLARLSGPDRTAFQAAFRDRIVRDCALHARRTLGARVELAGARRLTGGEWMLATRSQTSAAPSSTMMWRGRVEGAASFRVTDVLIDGRSAVQSARDEAADVVRQAEGDAAALLRWARR